jgi:hypothetical protein
MLARKLKIKYKDIDVLTTPLLLPSFSSRLNLDIPNTIDFLSDVVTGPFLISSYDFHHCDKFPNLGFSNLIFLDSGGYECAVECDVSEIGMYKPNPHKWDENIHLKAIQEWDAEIPTVVISYDHPKKRCTLENQVDEANKLFSEKEDILKEILVKPESLSDYAINIDDMIEKIELLKGFDIIGFTEKELGTSVLDRMIKIALIRKEMDEAGFQIPIHIFGSLDPITTPLYYFAGADIFDGLSWLRFVYDKKSDYATYINCIGPKENGIHATMSSLWTSSIYANYNYLRRLEINLKKYKDSGDFSIFGENEVFFKEACDDLSEAVGGI